MAEQFDKTVNPFDAPIPGQSLTDRPGNAAWEHPPQFTGPNEALEYIHGLLFLQALWKENFHLMLAF